LTLIYAGESLELSEVARISGAPLPGGRLSGFAVSPGTPPVRLTYVLVAPVLEGEAGEIAQLRGTAADRALWVQTEGDRALREGDVVRAAEDYGRVEEEVRYLRAERFRAIHARTLAHNGLERAWRDGC
jgi:hypothetical protein